MLKCPIDRFPKFKSFIQIEENKFKDKSISFIQENSTDFFKENKFLEENLKGPSVKDAKQSGFKKKKIFIYFLYKNIK